MLLRNIPLGFIWKFFNQVKKGVSDFNPRHGDASFGFHTSEFCRVELYWWHIFCKIKHSSRKTERGIKYSPRRALNGDLEFRKKRILPEEPKDPHCPQGRYL